MALALYDRVQQTGTANTTISFTLSGSVTGFQSFAVVGNGNTTYYSATDASGNWETGLGTYSTTGPTLTRTTIYQSSNANAAVTFSGTVNVFVTYPSGKSVNLDASGNATGLGTPAAFVATNVTGLPLSTGVTGTLPIANGGTNSTATATAGGAGYGTGTAHAYTAAGTSGQALISGGAGAPAFGTLAIGTANTNISGALTPTNGGTGVATLTGVAYGNGTSAFTAATAAQLTTAMGVASTSTNGYLSSTDWNTFNGKQAAGSYVTVGGALGTPSSGTLTNCTFPTLNQNTTGSSGSCTGNAATATTATNQSGGTVSATTGAFSGVITSTSGGGAIALSGATANRIEWNTNGVALPSFTTRSAGTKLVIYPSLSGTGVDYGFGIASGTLWSSVDTTSSQFQWYGGTTLAATLTGAGAFTAVGNITAYSDERLKKNWRPVQDNFVSKLAQVKSGIYDRTDSKVTQAGVSAQSLQILLPETIIEDAEGILSVNYGAAALVAAIELAKEVKALRAEIAQLKAK